MREFWNQHHQFIGFVTAISFCLLINLLALKCTNNSYRDGQNKILESYNHSLAIIDSLQKKNEDALNRILREREQTITRIISDTAINDIQGLCPKQKEAVKKYIQPYLEVTTRELDVKERIKANPNTEYQLMRDEIRNLLQLEFNKMQNEYEALELWAAILTVVFLIFSFYSFFKTEHLEEQGHQSIGRIGQMEENARRDLQSLRDRIATDNQNQTNRFARAFDEMLQSQRERFDEAERYMTETFQNYQARMADLIDEYHNQNHDDNDEDESVETVETDREDLNNTEE